MTLTDLVAAYRGKELTQDELFAALTDLLAAQPERLAEMRGVLDVDPVLREGFEVWLESLKRYPRILLGGKLVEVTRRLVSALTS